MGRGRWTRGGLVLAVLVSTGVMADPSTAKSPPDTALAQRVIEQIQADPQQAQQYLLAAGRHPDYRDRLAPADRERLLAAAAGSDEELADAARQVLRQDPAKLLSLYAQLAGRLTPEQLDVLETVLRELVVEGRIQAADEGVVYTSPSLWKKIALGGGVAAAAGMAVGGGGGGGGGSSAAPTPASEPEPEPEPEPFSPPSFPVGEAYSADYRHALIGTMQAHDRGYDGSGVVLGILDTGFRSAHAELDGQFVDYYNIFTGTSDPASVADGDGHGTHVAGLIGAKLNGTDVTGVAPGARLVGIRIADDAGEMTGTDAQLAAGVDYAVAAGAQFINNSWGFQTPVNQASADAFASWQPELLQAYRDAAAADRVMVFSTGNEGADYPDAPMVLAGLPALFPELAEHWVAVGAVGPDGVLTGYSQPCGAAASWCLVAPGGTDGERIISSYHLNDTSYAGGYGTSMAAPLVTGGLAVLKQRFPTLDNDQVIDRLFLTANKEGIYADTALYGQGLLDLDKATDPLGPLSVVDPTVTTSGGSSALPLEQMEAAVSASWGDGLQRALSGTRMAVADRQGAGFFIDLGAVTENRDRFDPALALARYEAAVQRHSLNLATGGSLQLAFASEDEAPGLEGFFYHNATPQAAWGYGLTASLQPLAGSVLGDAWAESFSAPALASPYLGGEQTRWTAHYGTRAEVGWSWGLTLLASRDGDDTPARSRTRGGVLSLQLAPWKGLDLGLQLGVGYERGGVLGARFTGAMALAERTPFTYTGLQAGWRLDAATRVAAAAYLGRARPAPGAGLIDGVSDLVSSSFALGIDHRLDEQRQLGLMVSQPLRIERGTMDMTLSTGYQGNRFNRRSLEADLTPSGRELDYELFYRISDPNRGGLKASLVYQSDAGHREGRDNALLLFSADRRF